MSVSSVLSILSVLLSTALPALSALLTLLPLHRRPTLLEDSFMRQLLIAAVLVAGLSSTAAAQKPAGTKLADVAGSWDIEAMLGPKDTVVATGVLTATSDTKGWTMTFSKSKPIPLRVLLEAGDSVVAEGGPYASVSRPGETVTKLTIVAHINGNQLTGTFEAHYDKSGTVTGKLAGTKKHS